MTRLVALALTLALVPVTAQAQATEVETKRIEMMRALDKTGRSLQAAAKGEAAIDITRGKQWAKDVATQFKDIAGLFPAGSAQNPETRASPKIWEDKAGFDKLMADMVRVAAAAESAITDEASFKAEIARVDGSCNDCHRVYRTPRRR